VRQHPRAAHERRIVSHVLPVPALQVSDPVAVFIPLKTCNLPFQLSASFKARSGEKLRSQRKRAYSNAALNEVLSHNICVVMKSMHEPDIEADFIEMLNNFTQHMR
jgi:hypothetical protein